MGRVKRSNGYRSKWLNQVDEKGFTIIDFWTFWKAIGRGSKSF
jgi:hypothetical protein